MMEPENFRIGNLMQGSRGIAKITQLSIDTIDSYTIMAWYLDQPAFGNSQEYLEPIPLTEEWLLKSGAYNEPLDGPLGPHTQDWHFKDAYGYFLRLWKTSDNHWIYVINNYHNSMERKLPHIKHVHQLQNLYFALTETELTIK